MLSELALHRREEALHHGVVVAIAPPAHAARDAARLEDGLVVFAGIRTALIGVVQQRSGGCRLSDKYSTASLLPPHPRHPRHPRHHLPLPLPQLPLNVLD